ncbi:hypothetical protein LX36DRAFT_333243 [Colletotrichum falcatum]|nr:hypothetical protein LX36DRAFT_333243 [Colletotrichum falcatum]
MIRVRGRGGREGGVEPFVGRRRVFTALHGHRGFGSLARLPCPRCDGGLQERDPPFPRSKRIGIRSRRPAPCLSAVTDTSKTTTCPLPAWRLRVMISLRGRPSRKATRPKRREPVRTITGTLPPSFSPNRLVYSKMVRKRVLRRRHMSVPLIGPWWPAASAGDIREPSKPRGNRGPFGDNGRSQHFPAPEMTAG